MVVKLEVQSQVSESPGRFRFVIEDRFWERIYGKLPIQERTSAPFPFALSFANSKSLVHGRGFYQPTLDEASVKLLSVLLFPADGFPTSPMRGSRGMAGETNKN